MAGRGDRKRQRDGTRDTAAGWTGWWHWGHGGGTGQRTEGWGQGTGQGTQSRVPACPPPPPQTPLLGDTHFPTALTISVGGGQKPPEAVTRDTTNATPCPRALLALTLVAHSPPGHSTPRRPRVVGTGDSDSDSDDDQQRGECHRPAGDHGAGTGGGHRGVPGEGREGTGPPRSVPRGSGAGVTRAVRGQGGIEGALSRGWGHPTPQGGGDTGAGNGNRALHTPPILPGTPGASSSSSSRCRAGQDEAGNCSALPGREAGNWGGLGGGPR